MPYTLRDDEPADEMGHAERNQAMLRQLERERDADEEERGDQDAG